MAVIMDHGRAWRGTQGRGEEDGAVAAHVGGARGVRCAGRRGGVREVEGRAGEACKQARAAGSHARGGVTGRVYAKAAANANAVLAFAAGAVLLMALLMENGAARAKQVVERYHAPYESKAAYFATLDAILRDRELIEYHEDTAQIRL